MPHPNARSLLLGLTLWAATALPGCSPSTATGQGDGADNRKIKEDVGKALLEPVPVTKGRSRPRGGGGSVDSSL